MQRAEITARHYDELLDFAKRYVGCPEMAADIVQEACLRFTANQPKQELRNSRAYLYRIVRNIAIDLIRHEATRRQIFDDAEADIKLQVGAQPLADSMNETENRIAARQDVTRVAQSVAALPPKCRQVFILRQIEGLDGNAVAGRLGISRNMVEKHLRKAMQRCRETLDAPPPSTPRA